MGKPWLILMAQTPRSLQAGLSSDHHFPQGSLLALLPLHLGSLTGLPTDLKPRGSLFGCLLCYLSLSVYASIYPLHVCPPPNHLSNIQPSAYHIYSLDLSIHPPIYPSTYPSIHPSTYDLSTIHPSIQTPISHLSIHPPIYPPNLPTTSHVSVYISIIGHLFAFVLSL